MDQRTVRVAVIAVLCIVALGAAAATLDTAKTTGGSGGTAGDGSGLGEGGGDSVLGGGNNSTAEGGMGGWDIGCLPFLNSTAFFLLVLAIVAVVGGLITWYENVMVAGAILLAFGMPLSAIYLLLSTCSPKGTGGGREAGLLNGSSGGGGGGGLGGDSTGAVTTSPSLVLLALVGVVLLVAVVAIARNTGDDAEEMHQPDPEQTEEETVEALGRVAGEAADRIDAEGDVDNEVYRAWREMVALLEVPSPEATTPGEFADAAVEAGMDRRDVAELTDLFEAVRYGGATPTEDREARAVDALRSIEDEYAGEQG